MSDTPAAPSRAGWMEASGISLLIRGFRLARSPRQLALAALAVLMIYAWGRSLDAVWKSDAQAVVVRHGGNEISYFTSNGFSRSRTLDWAKAVPAADLGRVGLFKASLRYVRDTVSDTLRSAMSLDLLALLSGVIALAGLGLWMVVLHPLFAILFGLPALFIFLVTGVAICRLAALQATRDDTLAIATAAGFARERIGACLFAPLIPGGIVLGVGGFLALCGLVGAIPYVGEVAAGVFWGLALVLGVLMTLLSIGLVFGWPLICPTIATEGSDAFDVFSRVGSYLFSHPWRAAFYALVATIYGGIVFVVVKALARLTLFMVHLCVGLGMNVGDVSGSDPAIANKLDALWKAPALDLTTPFYGEFGGESLPTAARIGAWLIKFWTYGVVTLVGAFMLSYLHSEATLIYLLLRRDEDGTDIEEIFLEEDEAQEHGAATPAPAAPAPAAATPGSLASLPVVGAAQPPPS